MYGARHEYHNDTVYQGWFTGGTDLDIVGQPVADFFNEQAVAYQTVDVPFQIVPVGDLEAVKATPITRSSNAIGPTNAPLPPSAVLSQNLQVIDLCTPNTEWGGGYGPYRQGTYLMIGAQMKTQPLEFPRYSYAAVDTDRLYEQAQQNIATLYADEKDQL